jgi:hypothetical protein
MTALLYRASAALASASTADCSATVLLAVGSSARAHAAIATLWRASTRSFSSYGVSGAGSGSGSQAEISSPPMAWFSGAGRVCRGNPFPVRPEGCSPIHLHLCAQPGLAGTKRADQDPARGQQGHVLRIELERYARVNHYESVASERQA